MPTLTVQTPQTVVRLHSERLTVETPQPGQDATKAEVPLAEIDRAVFAESTIVSTPALCELLRREIPVLFLSTRGRLLGAFDPPGPARGATRLLQYQQANDAGSALAFARRLIQAKIANGRRLLQRLDSNHHRLDAALFAELERRDLDAGRAEDLPSLLGTEGAAAAAYLAGWSRFLPPEFPFGQRSTRPPKNPVNACLSYTSAIVYGELLSACQVRGLDPSLGCLHRSEDGRWSLPLDLMEPFRPALIEPFTLRLFSHRILQAAHFQPHDDGVWLNTEGRQRLWQHYEQRLLREFYSEFAGCRTTLRQQIQNAAVQFKLALAQPETFTPFRLN